MYLYNQIEVKNMSTEKKQIRKKIKKELLRLSDDSKNKASQKICLHIEQLVKKLPTHTENVKVATYAAHQNEASLMLLHLSDLKIQLYYPKCLADHSLQFYHIKNTNELTPGKYGILEPNQNTHSIKSLSDVDLILCPGVAFTHLGQRLGQGGGYYDRSLAGIKSNHQPIIAGIALEQQILPLLPAEQHDIQMDYIITEERLHQCHS